jgi:hypothetical protein
MKTFNAFALFFLLTSIIYSQEKPDNQSQALRSNGIKIVKKILLQANPKTQKVDSFLVSLRHLNKCGLHTKELLYDTSDQIISEYFATYHNDSLIIESKSSFPDLKITYEYNDRNGLKNEKTFFAGKLSAIKNYYYKNDTLDKTEKYYLKNKSKNISGSFERNTFMYDRENDITTIKEEKSTHRKNELIESNTIIRWSQDKRTQSFWVTDRMSPKWFMTERKINFKEALKNTQEQFYRTNAFMNQDGLRISLSRGDKLLTENHLHPNGLIKETKIFRNNDLMATYIYQYTNTE